MARSTLTSLVVPLALLGTGLGAVLLTLRGPRAAPAPVPGPSDQPGRPQPGGGLPPGGVGTPSPGGPRPPGTNPGLPPPVVVPGGPPPPVVIGPGGGSPSLPNSDREALVIALQAESLALQRGDFNNPNLVPRINALIPRLVAAGLTRDADRLRQLGTEIALYQARIAAQAPGR